MPESPRQAIRCVLITMFQSAVEGGPGELALLRKRYQLQALERPVPGLEGGVYHNPERGILAVVTGIGTANTAVAPLLLALDGRFDLSESWWIVSGIAGIDPGVGTVGDVVLVDACVDGDLAFELHPDDAPSDWETGILPLGAREPYGQDLGGEGGFQGRYECQWIHGEALAMASEALNGLVLEDDPEGLAAVRGAYANEPRAVLAPSIKRGAVMSACRFWHGPRMNQWARRWVGRWTEGRSHFAVAAMEDSGTLMALERLSIRGYRGHDRCILLRAGSNFTTPGEGVSAKESLLGPEQSGESSDYHLPGMDLAVRNLDLATAAVVDRVTK